MEDNKQFPLPEEDDLISGIREPQPEEQPLITELTMAPAPGTSNEDETPVPDIPAAEEISGEDTPTENAEVQDLPDVPEILPVQILPEPEAEILPAPVPEETASAEEALPEPEQPAPEEDPRLPEALPEAEPVSQEVCEDGAVPEETDTAFQPEEQSILPEIQEDTPPETQEAFEPEPEAEPDPEPEDTSSAPPAPADPELTKTIEDIEALLDKPVDQDYQDREPNPEFDAMLSAAAPVEEAREFERPARKGRPKRKKSEGLLGIPNILATFVWLALIVVIGVTAGRMLWVCAADVLAFGREDKAVTITIYEADTMDDIVDKLHANGLIRYKSLFNLYASISDAQEDIKPGIYDLNTRYDYHALVNFMTPKTSREVVELTIPEGYTCQQIFALLEENRVCTAVDAAAYAANGELNDYWFLEGVERGTENCLEGYLFPDTYEFYKNSTPREALQRMLNNFEIKFTDEMRAQLDTLNQKLTGDYTIREITIVASLIEKESARPEESPKVAGVIYNRLFNWGNNPKLLGIDAAIVYAQGGESQKIDTSIDHPYNTYRNQGLTPGPISNPGLASLKAALNPETHNYFYYVLNPSTGSHQFSTTQAEHNAWIDQFYG